VVDLFAVVPLLTGVAFQIWAFAVLLRPESIQLAVYTRAKNHFLWGLAGVLTGTAAAILLDILKLSSPEMCGKVSPAPNGLDFLHVIFPETRNVERP
jgi:hypothetical protein